MRGLVSFLLVVCFIFFQVFSVKALGFFHKKSLPRQITEKIQMTNPHVNMGIKIIDLETEEVVFEQNADRYFYLASLTKILTCLGALKKWGPDYRFSTTLSRYGNDMYIATLY